MSQLKIVQRITTYVLARTAGIFSGVLFYSLLSGEAKGWEIGEVDEERRNGFFNPQQQPARLHCCTLLKETYSNHCAHISKGLYVLLPDSLPR